MNPQSRSTAVIATALLLRVGDYAATGVSNVSDHRFQQLLDRRLFRRKPRWPVSASATVPRRSSSVTQTYSWDT